MKCTEAAFALQNWRKEKENTDLEGIGAQLQYALGNEQQLLLLHSPYVQTGKGQKNTGKDTTWKKTWRTGERERWRK